MSNEFLVSNLIAKATGELFEITSALYNSSNHDYVDSFQQKQYATGGSIQIKIPGTPQVQRGLTVTATPIQDLTIPYTITQNDILSVTRNLNSDEYLFNIIPSDKALTKSDEQAIVDNYGFPAYQALSQQLETDCINQLLINSYLTPIDTVQKLQPLNNFASMQAIETMATYLNLKRNERTMMMNMTDAASVSNSLQNMFNTAINTKITNDAYVGGSADKGRLAGMDLFKSEFLMTNIAGPLGESNYQGATISSVSADGTQVTITGVTATTGVLINAGDMISVPSVFLVNEIGHIQIPYRLVLKASAQASGDGAGNVTITLPYPLMASGEHQNVVSLPATDAPVFFFPSYNQNYMYTRSGLSTVPLRMPPIYGAVNSDEQNRSARRGESFPMHVVMQGAALELANNYRTYCLIGKKAFAPYVLSVPSAVQ